MALSVGIPDQSEGCQVDSLDVRFFGICPGEQLFRMAQVISGRLFSRVFRVAVFQQAQPA